MKSKATFQIIGRAGGDAEVRDAADTQVARFSLATNTSRMVDGNHTEVTRWYTIDAWDGLAKISGQLVKKGTQVFVEGVLVPKKYVNKDGNEVSVMDLRATDIYVFGSKPKEGPDLS